MVAQDSQSQKKIVATVNAICWFTSTYSGSSSLYCRLPCSFVKVDPSLSWCQLPRCLCILGIYEIINYTNPRWYRLLAGCSVFVVLTIAYSTLLCVTKLKRNMLNRIASILVGWACVFIWETVSDNIVFIRLLILRHTGQTFCDFEKWRGCLHNTKDGYVTFLIEKNSAFSLTNTFSHFSEWCCSCEQ